MNNLLVDLEKVEVDVTQTLSRFMDNEELYLTFLYRFPEEKQFEELKIKVNNREYDEGILAVAHTLKGLTANLGMNNIYQLTAKIMMDIRNSQFDNIEETFLNLEKNYKQICNLIMKHKSMAV